MIENRKKVLYSVVIVLLNVTLALFTALNIILNIINWDSMTDIYFFLFSKCFWLLSFVTLLFHIPKLFNWLYPKLASLVNNARPEFFSTSSQYHALPKNKVYKNLKCATIILLLISMAIELIFLFI